MKPSYYNTNHEPDKSIDYLERCKNLNSELIQRLFRNNRYLLHKYGFTLQYQIDDLKRQGVIISRSGISRYSRGVYKTCQLGYLQIFATYWSIPLFQMISWDLECDDLMLGSH